MRKNSHHGSKDRRESQQQLAKGGRKGGGKGAGSEVEWRPVHVEDWALSYRFHLHQHPYVGALVQRLIEGGVPQLQAADTAVKADGKHELSGTIFSATAYKPTAMVEEPRPGKDLDFSLSGPYADYNWELFFHVPLTVAIHLSRNGRYAEARDWFHLVFDPTDNSTDPTPDRFWKVRPFRGTTVRLIEDVLLNLSTEQDEDLFKDTIKSITAWRDDPFKPHVVARMRPQAYMFKTLMAYLDNLIAWGDALFRENSRESTTEATQLYVLAAQILGRRPQEVPKKGTVKPQTYDGIRLQLNEFGNVLRDLEAEIPFDSAPPPTAATTTTTTTNGSAAGQMVTIESLGRALYFCVPRNDKLLGYWDTVADRLFKIHNSLDIRGVFRQLPLFEPPIDPALLAKASAAGVDVAAVVSGANQPLPLVRFQLLAQKASELAQEVKSLGNGLLSALEKEDGEALAIMRARHERTMAGLSETVRYGQWQEAIKAREGVQQSLANAAHRYIYYERQLGVERGDIDVPEPAPLDVGALHRGDLNAQEPALTPREISVDIVRELAGIPGGHLMSHGEAAELGLTIASTVAQTAGGILDAVAAPLSLIPQFQVRVTPFGIGAGGTFGGEQLSKVAAYLANVSRTVAGTLSGGAQIAGKVAGFARREQEWQYQSTLAAGEINQLFKQLRGAQLREALAEVEWRNHQQTIRHAEEIERFLADERDGKKTNQALYAWMSREVRGLYGRCFELAFDAARRAERALQQELGDPSLSFVEFGYRAGNEGLLAGDKLYLDIKRMELAYHELNRREYELTKHVSLLEVDPLALMSLRLTGTCTVTLPEELFDMDGPGHYFRRIKTVALSIPSVTGPHTSVPCTLTLLKSSIRKSPLLVGGAYERDGAEDARFDDHFGATDAIVTSSGQNDSGLFETSLRDERLLPFEGAGAISQWRLELPSELRQFDYGTIADVLLHVRFTAREGGSLLRGRAVANLEARIEEASSVGSARLLSMRHDFPTEWARFRSTELGQDVTEAPLTIELRPEHYPYWSQHPRSRLGEIKAAALLARGGTAPITVTEEDANTIALEADASFGDLRRGALELMPDPVGRFTLKLDDTDVTDLWLLLEWGAS